MISKEFFKECKMVRIKAGFTLKDMAQTFGTSPSALSKFERGQNNNLKILDYYLTLYNNYMKKDGEQKNDS